MKSSSVPPARLLSVLLFALSFILAPEARAVPPPATGATVTIPGPLRSFLRMAGISQKIDRDEVLPLLARNVSLRGYQGQSVGKKDGTATEFLILLQRYVDQARELMALAGSNGVIQVDSCAQAKPLLDVLGYRLRQPCGTPTSLETADAQRAFITIDSGFPLSHLEETLRNDKPFTYPYTGISVPVLFAASDWIVPSSGRTAPDLIDTLLDHPELSRLYWALSRLDTKTRSEVWRALGPRKLAPWAAVLDFYGGSIAIRSGRVVVPGGSAAEASWRDLAGADPQNPVEFISNLLSKDEGWLAAYFDVLSRLRSSEQGYFTDPSRLKRFYRALQGEKLGLPPARPVFRPNPGLLLLVTRLQFESNGQPHVPGNLEAWREVLGRKKQPAVVRRWAKRSSHWKNTEEVLEAMFAFARMTESDSPLQIFLVASEIDRGRAPEQRLTPETLVALAEKFSRFKTQFLVFPEFTELSDSSVRLFLTAIQAVDRIPNQGLRANAVGIVQGNIGIWQILARQGQIPSGKLDGSWQSVVKPFLKIQSSGQLFDAGRKSLAELLRAATGRSELSEREIVALLAGPEQTTAEGKQVHQMLVARMRAVLEDQRLVSLDTLFALADGLDQMMNGKDLSAGLLRYAREIQEFEMPRPLFTSGERTEWTYGLYQSRNTVLEVRADLTKLIKPSATKKQLLQARNALAPYLKNALVGLNYAYYEPPGAQMLHHNALFVRSHDFTGQMTVDGEQTWEVPRLFGSGLTASGGAYLAGSLADLPYVLSETEQNFIIPENVQALIWEGFVPGLLSSAIAPRWWGVTRDELRAVSLYQQAGEELLVSAVGNDNRRDKVMDILADRMLPQRLELLEGALQSGNHKDIMDDIMPGESFYLAAEYRRRFPDEMGNWGTAGKELDELARSHPDAASGKRLSQTFGIPHPALAYSYARGLVNVKPFPAFMGYSSRLLAESWESSNLYWARLADEMGYSPVMLNRVVPQLTHRMVEKIFATDFEDWPAVMRAMRETGDEFRQGKVASVPASEAVAQR